MAQPYGLPALLWMKYVSTADASGAEVSWNLVYFVVFRMQPSRYFQHLLLKYPTPARKSKALKSAVGSLKHGMHALLRSCSCGKIFSVLLLLPSR